MGEELVVNIKPKENNLKTYLAWLVITTACALAALTGGFALGKSGQLPVPPKSGGEATTSAVRTGWQVFERAGFSIQYPNDWQAKEHPAGEIPGARLTNPGGSVEFWLKVGRPYQFAQEQKEKQTGKKDSTIKVDERSGTKTEFSYESGGFFLIIEVPAAINKPEITFWAIAASEDYKKTALDVISSFKTKAQGLPE